MEPYRFTAGTVPLLVSMPHVGTHIPDSIAPRMTAAARGVPDTDWHVDRLYDFLDDLGAARIAATHSRYVIDLNRSPDGTALYPGASNTELCPTAMFDQAPIYEAGQEPSLTEISGRLEEYWQPYHQRLETELAAMQATHGVAVLFDAHSIRSRVPRFFDGRLPDINLGTGGGSSADPALAAAALEAASEAAPGEPGGYTSVLNGRFKGGYITRQYGRPDKKIHAIQLELSQIAYMDEDPPFNFRDDLANGVRPVLRRILDALLGWAKEQAG